MKAASRRFSLRTRSPFSAFQVGCKLSLVFFQYCIMANFYWLLVEGLYLHTLLVAIFSPSRCFLAYLLIGWGEDSPTLASPPAPSIPKQQILQPRKPLTPLCVPQNHVRGQEMPEDSTWHLVAGTKF